MSEFSSEKRRFPEAEPQKATERVEAGKECTENVEKSEKLRVAGRIFVSQPKPTQKTNQVDTGTNLSGWSLPPTQDGEMEVTTSLEKVTKNSTGNSTESEKVAKVTSAFLEVEAIPTDVPVVGANLTQLEDNAVSEEVSTLQEEETLLVRYLIRVGETVSNWLFTIGDFATFVMSVFRWLARGTRRGTLLPCMYEIGIMSLPVIALTGSFIGMVLAVQSYNQLKGFYLETRMGALINLSLVRELGPVLAATKLAGRIGSSIAAELGTMRVTEQIDALGSMGVNPIHYLVVPRFLGCVLLIPILTIFADFMGIVGGAYFSVWIYNIDWHFYLANSNKIVGELDVFIGVFKSLFFGATIGLIGCHRGFNSRAGAQGVGRAATEAFVFSFVFILLLDLALGTIFEALSDVLFTPMPRQL